MLIKKSTDEFQNYLFDAANYKGRCDSVVIPESEDEIKELTYKANRKRTRITVSGAGTGLTGGRVPEGGTVLSTERLNKIISIEKNEYGGEAIVQPGLVLADFQKEVIGKNLYYPPDPTETNCFIGGTLANNSSGAKSFKYGSTRNFVLSLKIVLPTGDSVLLERGKFKAEKNRLILKSDEGKAIDVDLPRYKMPDVKNAAGYYVKPNMDAVDLFIGSEGTLGIITEAKLKLLPAPKSILSAVIFFGSENDALDFVNKAGMLSRTDSIIDAFGLEFFDGNSLEFLKEDFGNIPDCSAAVWFEQEIDGDETEIIDSWTALIKEHNGNMESSWIAIDPNDRINFQNFRHAISAKVSDYVSCKNITKVGTDTAVPREIFTDYYFWCKKQTEELGLPFVVYGHFGDCHIHLNMLPKNNDEYKKAKENYYLLCKEAVRLGGTVSAEHGIGKLKREYLLLMYGERNIKDMAKVKKRFDSNLVLNIGNIIDERYLKI